jgi:uracil-DNA glycosylase
MIVGAYPSARFESRVSPVDPARRRLIPVADNLQPFGREEYFDGTRIRTLTSGDTLAEYILDSLGVSLEDCWVTDLVKVFLYKKSHVDSCGEVVPKFEVPRLRHKFYDLGRKSLPWLEREVEICQPGLILTLGQEVAQVIHGRKTAAADQLLRDEIIYPAVLNGYPSVHLPHPDACRRMEKWRKRLKIQLSSITQFLENN